MDWALYGKIIDELIDGPVERISTYLQNESALDPDIFPRRNGSEAAIAPTGQEKPPH